MEKYNLWPANWYHHHHHLVAVGTCVCSYRDALQAYYYPHQSAVLKSLKKYDSNKGEIGALAEPLNEQTTPKWIARESFSVNYESQKSLKKTAPPRDVETLRRVWEMCSQGEKMHPWRNNIIFFCFKKRRSHQSSHATNLNLKTYRDAISRNEISMFCSL